METVSNIPRWFWFVLIAIVVITGIAIYVCSRKKAVIESDETEIATDPIESAIDDINMIQAL